MNGMAPAEVVLALKHALMRAKREGAIPIKNIKIVLKAQSDKSAGFKLKIPFLNSLGIDAEAAQSITQTLEFEFQTIDLDLAAFTNFSEQIEKSVIESMEGFRQAVITAYDGLAGQPLKMISGSSEINFVFDAEGKVDLMFNVGLKQTLGNIVRITYNPPTS